MVCGACLVAFTFTVTLPCGVFSVWSILFVTVLLPRLYPIYDQEENESTKKVTDNTIGRMVPRGSNSGSFAGSFQLGRSLLAR
jgi:hypothetical protein